MANTTRTLLLWRPYYSMTYRTQSGDHNYRNVEFLGGILNIFTYHFDVLQPSATQVNEDNFDWLMCNVLSEMGEHFTTFLKGGIPRDTHEKHIIPMMVH